MKKRTLAILAAVILVAALCFAGGNYYLLRDNSSTDNIISLEIPPFCSELTLHEGETAYENFFEVISEGGFNAGDINFVSSDDSVAAAKYSVTDRNRYVCYKVEAYRAGEAEIYFTANGGKTVSEKITVKVFARSESATANPSQTSEATTESEYSTVDIGAQEPTASNTGEYVASEQSPTHTAEKDEQGTANATVAETEPLGDGVYVAPTGKRYHFSKSCAGKNAYKMAKAEAVRSGRTPCKKCVGG